MESIMAQTVLPDEIVIVKDGPVTDEVEGVLQEYIGQKPELYVTVPLEKNMGLGVALGEGLLRCKNELVARMDTDDICRPDRFEKQLAEFDADPDLDICGCHILEFEGSPENVVARRVLPLDNEAIRKFQRRRDAFNHMTVMYKKSKVLGAGNYQSCMQMEDSYLWVRMLGSGCKAKNIDDFLVSVRVGKDMFGRRGGMTYFRYYKAGRKKMRETGYFGFFDYHLSLMGQWLVCIAPYSVRRWIYKTFLHR